MRVEEQLKRTISERVSEVTAPSPDLGAVRRRGAGMRRRRMLGAGGALAAVVSVGLLAPALLSQPPQAEESAPIAGLDFSAGLRAFASPDPDGGISFGGRVFPRTDMGQLDTDATATPFGLVFFDSSARAHLLAEDGTDTVLAAPGDDAGDFRPAAKADAVLPLVAFTQPGDGHVEVVLYDLRAGGAVDVLEVACSGSECGEVTVEAVDRGLVFVRTAEGTYVWAPEAPEPSRWTQLGEGRFRVADVRNGRILWADAPPTPSVGSPVADWRFVPGAIDAQLSFDGKHILSWSRKLSPTAPDGAPVVLEDVGAIFFTFDTDGSVLAATLGTEAHKYYDCELASGNCVLIGTLEGVSGDPMFIGSDM